MNFKLNRFKNGGMNYSFCSSSPLHRNGAGFTLLEVIITVSFVYAIYIFITTTFFDSYRNISFGDVKAQAVTLDDNEMVRLTNFENPLYIGLSDAVISDLKNGTVTAWDLVQSRTIVLGERRILSEETKDTSDSLRDASYRVNYTRNVEWEVEDVRPLLVHIWVIVKWTDPRKEMKDGTYQLETLLSQ